jgi:hypothetical protein
MFQVTQLRSVLADLRIGISFATVLLFEQLAETAILLMAASFFHSSLQL